MIKAIETTYKGYKFRSRLEARWAVFFDNMQLSYQYEKEGYDLGGGLYYLPDFWLPQLNCFVEIKPPGYEYSMLCDKLSQKDDGVWVLNIFGDPYPGSYEIYPYKNGVEHLDTNYPYVFATDRRDKGVVWIENDYVWIVFNEKTDHDRFPLRDSSQLIRAYTAARQARFEHGEGKE